MSSSSKNLILADDDADDVELFQLALQEACIEHKLIVAADGAVLLEKLSENASLDLIILDLNMPRVDGFHCIRKIRSDSAYDKVPIIILSTRAFQPDIQYCLSNGASKFYKKPFSFSELCVIVKSICDEYIN